MNRAIQKHLEVAFSSERDNRRTTVNLKAHFQNSRDICLGLYQLMAVLSQLYRGILKKMRSVSAVYQILELTALFYPFQHLLRKILGQLSQDLNKV